MDNVIIEPGATSTTFLVYGTRGDKGVMYHVDFSQIGVPTCSEVWSPGSLASYYVLWTPTDKANSEGCLMGKQITYTGRLSLTWYRSMYDSSLLHPTIQ